MSQRTYNRRQSRGLIAQLQQVILHPVAFFRALPNTGDSRTWLWMALLILALVGYASVQQAPTQDDLSVVASENTIQDNLVTGLTSASVMVMAWFGQAILLLPLPMLRSKAPNFGLNLQIAIWASVPFLILSVIQIALSFAGLESGYAGISGIIERYPELWGWDNRSSQMQVFILNITAHITLFGLWHLVLLYFATRFSLNASSWISLIFLLIWVFAIFLLPTLLEILLIPSSPATSF